MRQEYEMMIEQLARILDASKPTPVMFLSGGTPMFGTPQSNANVAWAILGRELGFAPMSVRPVPGKGERFFTAEPAPLASTGTAGATERMTR
jgi:hypothetical protein